MEVHGALGSPTVPRRPKIAQLILERRIVAGVSQVELAARLQVAESTVQRWERGEVVPRAYQLAPLGRLLDVELGELAAARATTAGNRRRSRRRA